jgi:bifunctional non-homologous end joining protein LigD
VKLDKILSTADLGARLNEHCEGDGAIVFKHACRLGLEGIVSKRRDLPYRSGRSKAWIKSKTLTARQCCGWKMERGETAIGSAPAAN